MEMASSSVQILLVEDNPHDAELTLRALKNRNLANHLIHVTDGQQAVDWLLGEGAYVGRDIKQHPKVILLDLKLPKLDGIEVLRIIRSTPETRCIPVVMLTSSFQEQDVIESYQLGVNSYIVKPVEFENFASAVEQAGHYWLLINKEPR